MVRQREARFFGTKLIGSRIIHALGMLRRQCRLTAKGHDAAKGHDKAAMIWELPV